MYINNVLILVCHFVERSQCAFYLLLGTMIWVSLTTYSSKHKASLLKNADQLLAFIGISTTSNIRLCILCSVMTVGVLQPVALAQIRWQVVVCPCPLVLKTRHSAPVHRPGPISVALIMGAYFLRNIRTRIPILLLPMLIWPWQVPTLLQFLPFQKQSKTLAIITKYARTPQHHFTWVMGKTICLPSWSSRAKKTVSLRGSICIVHILIAAAGAA